MNGHLVWWPVTHWSHYWRQPRAWSSHGMEVSGAGCDYNGQTIEKMKKWHLTFLLLNYEWPSHLMTDNTLEWLLESTRSSILTWYGGIGGVGFTLQWADNWENEELLVSLLSSKLPRSIIGDMLKVVIGVGVTTYVQPMGHIYLADPPPLG